MYNAYPSVASTSLSASGTIAEEYVPMWIHSSGTASAAGTTPGYLQKGSTSTVTANTGTAIKLLNPLSSLWSPNQKFAIEASFYTNNSAYTAYVELYDLTASSWGNTLSTTATTATVLRGSTITLIPGHSYALAIFSSNASGTTYLTKAHLVALEM